MSPRRASREAIAALTLYAVAGAIVYKLLKSTVGLRLDEEAEFNGADLSIHRISATPERDSGI